MGADVRGYFFSVHPALGLLLVVFAIFKLAFGPSADDLTVGVAPPSVRENPNSYRPVVVTRPTPSYSGGSGGGYSGGK